MTDKVQCIRCKEEKETSLFPTNNKVLRGFDSWCKGCHKQYGKQHRDANIEKYRIDTNKRRKNRVLWLQSLKNNPCKDCGKLYDPHCMDFDHLRDKTKAVTRMLLDNVSKEKILEEIEKCDLVCVLCHNIRTQKRLDEKYPIKKYNKYTLRNINIINQAKNQPCSLCGSIYPSYNMQLDHIDPHTKYKDISKLKNFKLDTLIKEIEKCQVFCALCHRRKSIWEQQAKKYPTNRIKLEKIKPLSDYENRIKECIKCNLVKSFDLFASHKKTKDGYNSWCKDCFNEYRKDRRKL